MLIVIGLMVFGVVLGYVLRERNVQPVHKFIGYAIYALLFLLGISVGSNDGIMDNLDTIGYDALLITLGAVAGSIGCAWLVYRFFFLAKK